MPDALLSRRDRTFLASVVDGSAQAVAAKKPAAKKKLRAKVTRPGRLGNAVVALVRAVVLLDTAGRRSLAEVIRGMAADPRAARVLVRSLRAKQADVPPAVPPATATGGRVTKVGMVAAVLATRPGGTTTQFRTDITVRFGVELKPGDVTAAVGHLRKRRGAGVRGIDARLVGLLPLLVERLGPAALVRIIDAAGRPGG